MGTFKKTAALTDNKRDMWKKITTKDFISSEESGEDIVGMGENQEKRQVLYVKPLQWRAPKVGRFFKVLDHKAAKTLGKGSNKLSPVLLEKPQGVQSHLVLLRTSLVLLLCDTYTEVWKTGK